MEVRVVCGNTAYSILTFETGVYTMSGNGGNHNGGGTGGGSGSRGK